MRYLPDVHACGESAATPEYFLMTFVTVEITLTVVFSVRQNYMALLARSKRSRSVLETEGCTERRAIAAAGTETVSGSLGAPQAMV